MIFSAKCIINNPIYNDKLLVMVVSVKVPWLNDNYFIVTVILTDQRQSSASY